MPLPSKRHQNIVHHPDEPTVFDLVVNFIDSLEPMDYVEPVANELIELTHELVQLTLGQDEFALDPGFTTLTVQTIPQVFHHTSLLPVSDPAAAISVEVVFVDTDGDTSM
jgi:hypothetical protein